MFTSVGIRRFHRSCGYLFVATTDTVAAAIAALVRGFSDCSFLCNQFVACGCNAAGKQERGKQDSFTTVVFLIATHSVSRARKSRVVFPPDFCATFLQPPPSSMFNSGYRRAAVTAYAAGPVVKVLNSQ